MKYEVLTDWEDCYAESTYEDILPSRDVTYLAAFRKAGTDSVFSDVKSSSAYYFRGAEFCFVNNLMRGAGDGKLGVGKTLTRAEFASILYKYVEPDSAKSGALVDNATGLPDVENKKWYTAAANWAVKKGYINGKNIKVGGKTVKKFCPNDLVTCEQMVAIIGNAFGYEFGEPDIAQISTDMDYYFNQQVKKKYPDGGQVSIWAQTSMAYAVYHGLVGNGKELKPTENIRRERVAAIIENLWNLDAQDGHMNRARG